MKADAYRFNPLPERGLDVIHRYSRVMTDGFDTILAHSLGAICRWIAVGTSHGSPRGR
jgi:hypothetical protein